MADYHFPSLPVYTPDPTGGSADIIRQGLTGGQAYESPDATAPLPIRGEAGEVLTSIRTDLQGMSTPFLTIVSEVYIRFGDGPAVHMYTNSLTAAHAVEAAERADQAATSAELAIVQATDAAGFAAASAFDAEQARIAAEAAAGTGGGGGSGGTGPHTHLVAEIRDMSATGATVARGTPEQGRGALRAGRSSVTVAGEFTGAAAPASATVNLEGIQTVRGKKTFIDAPGVPDNSFTIEKTAGLRAALDAASAGGVGLDVEAVQDTVAAMLAGTGGNVTATYNDATGKVTLTGATSPNLVAGAGVTLAADSNGNLVISATGGGGGGNTYTVKQVGTTWPARPTADAIAHVIWKGTTKPPLVASGTGGMLDGDSWFKVSTS